jgi:UDP-N-acetylmuramoyl-tripeptide--D-alanyl-D-alanine ligase
MAELGQHTAAAHREVGQKAFELGLTHLVTVGPRARPTAEAARHAGLAAVTECADVAAAVAVLRGLLRPGDLVLLKASRAAGLERLGQALRGKAHPDIALGTPASAGGASPMLQGMLRPLPAEAGAPRCGTGAVAGFALRCW